MRYQDFIAELRVYLNEARRLRETSVTHEDSGFRSWRHGTESLVHEALKHGYRLPGEYKSAGRFYLSINDMSHEGMVRGLARDIGDSQIELAFLVDQFEKYGVPAFTTVSGQVADQLSAPEKVTLSWLFRHVPVHIWLIGIGLLGAAFVFGVGVARTEAYLAAETWFKAVTSNK